MHIQRVQPPVPAKRDFGAAAADTRERLAVCCCVSLMDKQMRNNSCPRPQAQSNGHGKNCAIPPFSREKWRCKVISWDIRPAAKLSQHNLQQAQQPMSDSQQQQAQAIDLLTTTPNQKANPSIRPNSLTQYPALAWCHTTNAPFLYNNSPST